jgi:hypothetical protein
MKRRKDVFLVNLWREAEEHDRPPAADWRGSVEHVRSSRRLYFTDLIELVAFLAGYTSAGELESGKNGT